MRIIVNCSNLRIGGGIQVALSFIQEFIGFPENEYHVFLSPQISSQIDKKKYPYNFNFYHFEHSISSFRYAYGVIMQLKKIENIIKPDCVFTVFGPSYWTPKSKHLMGYAMPHYVYPEYLKKVRLSLKEHYLNILKKKYHKFFLKKNAEYYYSETANVSKRLSQFVNINEKKVFTIGNTYNHVFNNPLINLKILPSKKEQEFRLITISSYYIHKNLTIINEIIPLIKTSNINIKFILTIPENIFRMKFMQNSSYIINVGPVPISHCPYLYANSDALFLPTLLECFSASYPEAMKMKKPILTSDLSFAHDICGDAAEYFNPLNPKDIANKIIDLANDKNRQKELINNGERRLLDFETPKSRAEKLLAICSNLIKMQ